MFPLAAQKSEQPSTKTDEEAADKEGNFNCEAFLSHFLSN